MSEFYKTIRVVGAALLIALAIRSAGESIGDTEAKSIRTQFEIHQFLLQESLQSLKRPPSEPEPETIRYDG